MRPGRGSWLIILLIAAIASSLIFMLAPARQPPAQTRLRTEQGYYVREGTLTGTGADGRILYRITTQAARQNLDDGTISMQEVAVNFPGLAGSDGRDQVAELAALLPGYTPIYAPATDLPDGGGGRKQFGNAIFSRLPVGQVWRHLLPWPVDAGVPSMQRVLLEVVARTEFGPLRVMTTHLEYYSLAQRQAQIDAIRRLHAEACAGERQ